MRAALYLRVSTDQQSVSTQRRDLLAYCDARKIAVVREFEDVGVSGAKRDRPALDDLMKRARRREFDAVIVWRFDRFARSVTHLLAALEEFRALGVEFISYSEGVDTSTPAGKMIFVFLGAVGEFERSLIQERVRAGIARAKAEGIHCGRPSVAVDVEKALRLRQEGRSLRQIAKALGVGCGTVQRALAGGVPKTPPPGYHKT